MPSVSRPPEGPGSSSGFPSMRQLRQFLAVADHGSFRGASRALNIAQPALTRSIQNLEQSLGVSLLTRTRQGVRLTPAGVVLAEGARGIQKDALELAFRAVRAERGLTGNLRIAYTDFAIAGTLPKIVKAFRQSYPDVVLQFLPMVSGEQLPAVRNRAVDIAFLTGPLRDDRLRAHVVQQDPLVAVLPDDHRLARATSIPLQALARESFVMGEARKWSHFLAHVATLCQRQGFLPQVVQEATDSDAILGLVAAGIGVSLSVQSVAARRREGVVSVPLAGRPYFVDTLMVCHVANENPAVATFEEIVSSLSELPARGAGREEPSGQD